MARGRLAGKSAIVTGGGSGIGRATCQLFAKEGANVAVLDVNGGGMKVTLESLPSNHGNKHCIIHCDITVSEQIQKAIKTAEDEFSQCCTLLVNCAGRFHPMSRMAEASEKDFDVVIKVNLKGTFLMNKEFVKSLLKNKLPGSIVNISSVAAKGYLPGYGSYGASKAGVVQLSKTIAKEYRRDNIRCNAILPGLIMTPMMLHLSKESIAEIVASGKVGKPEDVAYACLFLASDESSFISGACLDVSGGTGIRENQEPNDSCSVSRHTKIRSQI